MTFEEWVLQSDAPNIFKDFVKHYKQYSYMAVSLRILKGCYTSKVGLLDDKINDEIYEQMFILTATGDNLSKLGEEIGLRRQPGESDVDYRDRLLNYNIAVSKGPTQESIRELFLNLGYTISSFLKTYYTPFQTDSAGTGLYSYTGSTGIVISQNWINYTCYIFLSTPPTIDEITILEATVNELKKVYNRVFVR